MFQNYEGRSQLCSEFYPYNYERSYESEEYKSINSNNKSNNYKIWDAHIKNFMSFNIELNNINFSSSSSQVRNKAETRAKMKRISKR